jgi:hypothetical protein
MPTSSFSTSTKTTSTSSTPTVFTRHVSKLALIHILVQRPRINEALTTANIEDITDCLQLNDLTIDALTYDLQDSNNATTTHQLHRGQVGMIKSFIHYIYH